MIRKRKAEKAEGKNSENKSLLDYMIEISEKNPDFTEDDIIDEACTFMLAVSDLFNYHHKLSL
jgi:cytochrome P450 family 4